MLSKVLFSTINSKLIDAAGGLFHTEYLSKKTIPCFVIPFLLILGSCTSGPQHGASGTASGRVPPAGADLPHYETLNSEIIIPLYAENGEASPHLRFTLELLDFAGPLRSLLRELLYDGRSPETYTNALVDAFKLQYAESKESYEAYPDMPSAVMDWDYTERISAAVPAPDIVVIERYKEYYTGGAHGMQTKQYFTIDTGAVIRLSIGDLIADSGRPLLRQRIEDELRILGEVEAGEPLSTGLFFMDAVEIPDNFFITKGGLGFHWDPYEIAPYVVGPIEIIIPIEQLQDILISPRPF
jgi:hypothetical protein